MTIDRVSFSVVTEPVGVRNTDEERETLIEGKAYSFKGLIDLINVSGFYYPTKYGWLGEAGTGLHSEVRRCLYTFDNELVTLYPDNRRSARYLRKAWQYVNKGLL